MGDRADGPKTIAQARTVESVRFARLCAPVGLLACLLLPGAAQAAGTPFQRTWASDQIHLAPALSAGYDGHGVTVAVLDGWIDTSHPDFQGRAIQAADCTSGTCKTPVTRDACGQQHGTHVAGTVASSSYGVAPRARLLAVRVLAADSSGDCAGTPTAVAAGIHWAIAHGAKVLNLSLGPDVPNQASRTIPDAVRYAADAGAVVVFSAGNADLPVAQSYGSDALVVAATGPSGGLADYSQHGAGVSVAAPGGQPNSADSCSQATCITSLYPGNRYAVAAGTSMAAPHVAGLAALLFQQRPGRSRADVISMITGSAHALSGAGAGRIDVAAALGVKITSPHPKPAATRSSSPRPHVVTSPTRAAVRAASSPSPLPPKPTPTSAPATPSPTPSAVASAPSLTEQAVAADDQVPVPLAGIAGALVGLAATAVLVFGRR
jgi:subtilisin family serine protease